MSSKYTPTPQVNAQIDRVFTYQKPKDDQQPRFVAIREKAKELAMLIASETPPSREQSLSLTHLEEVVMFANASIVRNE